MGQDEDGNIVNNGGNMPPGLNRREKTDKEENPNPPSVPENPGTEDSDDASVNSAQKGTHIYTYDELNRMVTSNIAKTENTYTYDTLGNLVSETIKNKTTDYQYNELNQLVSRKAQNQSYTYTYDKRGNRIVETGKKETREYVYDETNHLVEGTNWKGDVSSYTYNGVDVRINNTQTSHSGSVYSRDYVIDYTSLERDDLMVFAEGDGQLDYVQREVYAGSERIEQFTDRSNGGYERLLYVHEDLMGNTRYYTKANGQSYAELTYDAWEMPESPNKLLNNDHGNYVYAMYTGHIFDTTLDIYFAEARFYDANTRTWLAMDPIKDGDNWYQYCNSNPVTYWDPLGLYFTKAGCQKERNTAAEILDSLLGELTNYGKSLPDWLKNLVGKVQNILPSNYEAPFYLELMFEYYIRQSDTMRLVTFLTRVGALDGALGYFNFEKDDNGIYHVPAHCWQQYGGYSHLYDFLFDIATSMDNRSYEMTINGQNYVIWMWKGDYLNLGAGAETAIYIGSEPLWEVDTSLAMPMTLSLYNNNGEIFTYAPGNTNPQWWITGFDPKTVRANAYDLIVKGSIDFSSHPEIYNQLKKDYDNNQSIWSFPEDKKYIAEYEW